MTVANTLLNHKKKIAAAQTGTNIAFVLDLTRANHRMVTNGYKGQATVQTTDLRDMIYVQLRPSHVTFSLELHRTPPV